MTDNRLIPYRNKTIEKVMHDLDKLKETVRRNTEELETVRRYTDDSKIMVRNQIKGAEEELEEHQKILWYETIRRILQGELFQRISSR